MVKDITSRQEFDSILKDQDFFLLLFYTNSSEKSLDAKKALGQMSEEEKDIKIYSVDAKKVNNIHPDYGVTTVPTVVVFKKGKNIKQVQGALTSGHYQRLLMDAPVSSQKGDSPGHSVVVYTTPSCPWCNKVKSYLRQNRVRFREVDVARDQRAAQELVQRSGQTGVPQVDIDGQLIVGFDQPRIDSLLGLKKSA
ncbi:glutaredoxin [candidate division KSB1 bacterium]|nr:MAG: glutaredoxin [candidate division KSB1 bacterium]